MARKLSQAMIAELKTGTYREVLKCIKKDKDLSLEIRPKDEVKIYYQKGLVLTLALGKKPKLMNPGYTKNHIVDLKFESESPQTYFNTAKSWIRHWKDCREFTIQQNIVYSNQDADSRYCIIDMEYEFSQAHLPKELRNRSTRPDLVGIDRETNAIVLFELKQGLTALKGKSGIDDHFEKTKVFIENPQFRQALKEDVESIIEGKKALGLLNKSVPMPGDAIRMAYIFAYNDDCELKKYKEMYADRYWQEGVETLYVDTRYKLCD